ncbi:MAG TPA: hypothetical protein VMD30_02595 [Tepidisphaeraceae bacterium]|nr:hypothetical protein [Tepidisphaeraceae bacterium]
MNLALIQVSEFVARWRRLRLNDEDLRALETQLLFRPDAGRPMEGTGGLRKLRFAPPSWHRGKSGAMRVAYVYFPKYERIYLITLYTKEEKDNLTRGERNRYRQILGDLAASLERRRWKG